MLATASRTSLTTAQGRMIDLLNPVASDIDFNVICEHLAKANRYCGATPGLVYSVAEHSVRCAQAAIDATGDKQLAAYLLCHDMHEAYLGDDTTPKKRALEAIMGSFGTLADSVQSAFGTLTDRLDTVIHLAAGLPWEPANNTRAAIHLFDRVLLATEWRDLMRCEAPYDFGFDPLPSVIVPVRHWRVAKRRMLSACRDLLPAMQEAKRA